MQVKGKITIADVEEGNSRTTGTPWMKCHYVLAYNGKWSNGTSCIRTLAFSVFGKDRLHQLGIYKDQVGVLEFETKGDIKTSNSGNRYETLEIDVLNWTVDAAHTPHEVTAQPKLQPVAPQNETVMVGTGDPLPF